MAMKKLAMVWRGGICVWKIGVWCAKNWRHLD